MSKYFGTDGVRGTVGQSPMTPDFVLRLGYAAGKVLAGKIRGGNEHPAVLIGKDTRISGYMVEAALEAGFSAAGVDVLLCGPLPTPGVAYLTRALRLSAAEREHLFHAAGLAPPGQGTVPAFITPSVQRMLDRLIGTPVAVFDAALNLLLANPQYTALLGESIGKERNAVWRNFLGSGNRVRHTPQSLRELQTAQANDLRACAARYPADAPLRNLIAELRTKSSLFAQLWDSADVGPRPVGSKTIDHPQVGALTLDCDLLKVAGSDLTIMVYTAEPGTEDAEKLALIAVLGTQSLVG